MLKPTFGNVPKLQSSIDALITQLELYLSYRADCLAYDLATSGFDEYEADQCIKEYEQEDQEVFES